MKRPKKPQRQNQRKSRSGKIREKALIKKLTLGFYVTRGEAAESPAETKTMWYLFSTPYSGY